LLGDNPTDIPSLGISKQTFSIIAIQLKLRPMSRRELPGLPRPRLRVWIAVLTSALWWADYNVVGAASYPQTEAVAHAELENCLEQFLLGMSLAVEMAPLFLKILKDDKGGSGHRRG